MESTIHIQIQHSAIAMERDVFFYPESMELYLNRAKKKNDGRKNNCKCGNLERTHHIQYTINNSLCVSTVSFSLVQLIRALFSQKYMFCRFANCKFYLPFCIRKKENQSTKKIKINKKNIGGERKTFHSIQFHLTRQGKESMRIRIGKNLFHYILISHWIWIKSRWTSC